MTRWRSCWLQTRCGATGAAIFLGATVAVMAMAASHNLIVNVDGQNLHIETVGDAGPPIVFEAGLGNDSSTWRRITGRVAKFARVILYDRAGLGHSLPMMNNDSPLTADQVATRLRKLLTTAGIRPPYILVGHSLGGLYVQMFARKYPNEVSGVVLLDSASAEAPRELKTRARLRPGSAAYLQEEGVTKSDEEVANAGRFPDIPLMVVAATDHGPFFKRWEPTLMRLQQQLASLSPRGALTIAQGSGHYIQNDRPKMVINAIRRVIQAAASGSVDPTAPEMPEDGPPRYPATLSR
jgi:pimeloyl-ACP methyl ester carboxylesterase